MTRGQQSTYVALLEHSMRQSSCCQHMLENDKTVKSRWHERFKSAFLRSFLPENVLILKRDFLCFVTFLRFCIFAFLRFCVFAFFAFLRFFCVFAS
jgi:hypothetical protein